MATADPKQALLAIAAEAREFAGLLRHAVSHTALGWPLRFARSAQIGGETWHLAADGPGPELAGHAAGVAFASTQPRAVISTGFCGAAAPALQPGAVFVAGRIVSTDGEFPALAPRTEQPFSSGTLESRDHVAVSVEEKREVLRRGAAAMEMEAAAVARKALESGVPFYCVRVVSDSASDPLPLDFNLYRDHSGRFDRGRILAAALRRPSSWTGLVRLARNSRRAAITLGDFLVHCRF